MRHRDFIQVTGLTLLAAVLRFHALETKSLWVDEVFTFLDASHPFTEIHRVVYSSPPLFYYIVRLFYLAAGRSDFWLRAPSALVGTLTIPAFYMILKRFFGYREALTGGLLLMLSPFHILYSQEARMYTLGALEAAGSLYFLNQALDEHRPSSSSWIGFAVVNLLGLYTHNWFLFFTASQGLWFVVHALRKHSLDKQGAVACLSIGLFYLPWLPMLVKQSLGSHFNHLHAPGIQELIHTWLALTGVRMEAGDGVLAGPSRLMAPMILLSAIVLTLGLLNLRSDQLRARSLFLTGCVGPLLMAFFFSRFFRPLYLPSRYTLMALPAFLIPIACAPFGPKAWARKLSAGLLCLWVSFWLALLPAYYRFFEKADWAEVTSWIMAQQRAGDAVWTQSVGYESICLDYYLPPTIPRGESPQSDSLHQRIFIPVSGISMTSSMPLGPRLSAAWTVQTVQHFFRDSVIVLDRK